MILKRDIWKSCYFFLQYMQFLESCCRLLKLDIIASDVGMDMIIDAIMTRCNQIQKMEIDVVNEKQTLIYNIQRKNKALKEQLESRDLHIDLLRKKVGTINLYFGWINLSIELHWQNILHPLFCAMVLPSERFTRKKNMTRSFFKTL